MAGATLVGVQSWLARRVLGYTMRRLRAGDARPTLMLDAPGVRLTFPGDSSWSGEHRGRDQVAAWLERFVRSGIQIHADQVIAQGWPWNTTICVRGTDHLDDAGELVYENRYVIWGRLRWGRLQEYEVYEDTQKAAELDAWLERHGRALGPAAPGR
jgi:ketosteroid isomerase-like protein